MDEDLSLERAVLAGLIGEPSDPIHPRMIFRATFGSSRISVFRGRIIKSTRWLYWALDPGERRGVERDGEIGEGWLITLGQDGKRIQDTWPPCSFEELVEKLRDPEFRRKFNLPPLEIR